MRALRTSAAGLAAALALAAASASAQRAATPPARPAARPATAPAPADTLFTVTGAVYDSVAAEPMAGATIQLAAPGVSGRIWVATAGADGSFRIDSVPRGQYVAAFVHPTLDVLGIESPVVPVRVGPGVDSVKLGVPGSGRLFSALCPPSSPRDSLGALVGRVHDADADVGIPSKIVVTWVDYELGTGGFRRVNRRVPATSRPDGTFLVCGLPTGSPLEVGAEAPKHTSGLIEVTLPFRGVLRRDLALADSAAAVAVALPLPDGKPGETGQRVLRGTARVAGAVRQKNGQPLAGARVSVEGTGMSVTTAEDGTFSLGGLPAGTYSLVARAVGYEPRAVPVDLSSRRPASASVVLDAHVQTLGSVTVLGKKSRQSRDLDGFLERRERGFGKYVTAEDIERQHPITLTDALQMTPGIHLASRGGGIGNAIRGRAGCTPTVVIDGMAVQGAADDIDDMIHPSDVAGIEVYSDAAGAPAEYGMSNCGTVLIWTKR